MSELESISSNITTSSIIRTVSLGICIFSAFVTIAALGTSFIPVDPNPVENIWIAKSPLNSNFPFLILRSHFHREPFNLLWGLEGLRRASSVLRWLLMGLVILLPFLLKRNQVSNSSPVQKPLLKSQLSKLFLFVSLLSPVLFFTFQVSYRINRTFGDGAKLPDEINEGSVFAAEVLTCHLFNLFRFISAQFGVTHPGLVGIVIVSCLAGGLFLAGATLVASNLSSNSIQFAGFFAGVVVSGYLAQFFGYVETTSVFMGMSALYFAFGIRYLQSGKTVWKVCAALCLSLGIISHGAGLLLLPSLLVLAANSKPRKDFWRMTIKAVFGIRFLVTVLLVLAPFIILVVKPYFMDGNVGNISGGSDGIRFVPWHPIDYQLPVSPTVYYSVISKWHFLDILSALFVAAPLSCILLVGSFVTLKSDKPELSPVNKSILFYLGTAALFCVFIPLFWNHDFGMWGDWNLATTYFWPLNLFGWSTYLLVFGQNGDDESKLLKETLPSMLVVQIVSFLGLFLQLY